MNCRNQITLLMDYTEAHILTQQTRKQHQERYEAKLRLVRILYQHYWEKQRIIDLFYPNLSDVRCRSAVQEMREDPSKSACRRRFQTTVSGVGQKLSS